jgi:hypothetical protein
VETAGKTGAGHRQGPNFAISKTIFVTLDASARRLG